MEKTTTQGYYISRYHKYIQYSCFFQIISNRINFVKIKI
jgi:hypothetical protein